MNIAPVRPSPLGYLITALMLTSMIGCVSPSAPYRLLSDEVISTIKSPPYSEEQVRHAQSTLRQRISARLSETAIQSELKSFACLIVSQTLDHTTAQGERAPSELPCSYNPKQRCSHRCKRSRLPRHIKLPDEYASTAKRHDDILWDELNALSDSGINAQWESYLTGCLHCQRASEVKRMVCLRDVEKIELTAKRTDHQTLDRWLNQCDSLQDPTVKALITYRDFMLTPAEDLSYPLEVPFLLEELKDQLAVKAMIGEAMRLLRGSLDGEKIATLLEAERAQSSTNERWLKLKEGLRRRLDAPLMPCLEHGLDTCTVTGQITLAREQAPRYLNECTLCEHRDAVEAWRAKINLDLEPVWQSANNQSTQALMRHQTPTSLIINEGRTLTRFSLDSTADRLKWRQTLQSKNQNSDDKHRLQLWFPRFRQIRSPLRGSYPLIISSDYRAIYGVDPDSGELRWVHRYPFTPSGKLVPCLSIDSLPAELLSGPLSNGGAICYKKSVIHFLNHLGEPSLKLSCPDPRGCGTLVALNKLNKDPLDTGVTLLMSHPALGQEGLTLTQYDLSELSLLRNSPDTREAKSLTTLSGIWETAEVFSTSHNSPLPPVLFIGVKRIGRRLSLHVIDLHSQQELWKVSLPGRVLIHRPSLSKDNQSGIPLLGVLTNQSFSAYQINNGKRIYRERLRLQKSNQKERKLAASKSLSWRSMNGTLIVLHSLNKRLYVKKNAKPLSKRSIKFDSLSASASLTQIDSQWVISSPHEGHIYGLSPLLDGVIWKWVVKPFENLSLSRNWALFTYSERARLYQITPKSLDEVTRGVISSEPLSPCALGDRWDCLFSGDKVIGLLADVKSKERSKNLLKWFNMKSHTLSTQDTQLSKVEAIIAQGSWAVACQWGLPQACTRLGMFAELGFYSRAPGELSTGVPALKAAYQYYDYAAQQGDDLALERSAVLLEKGQGTPQDYAKARQSYFEACEAGYTYSCERWGFLNELGLGGSVRFVTAISAYQRACKEGSLWSCERLKQDKFRQLY